MDRKTRKISACFQDPQCYTMWVVRTVCWMVKMAKKSEHKSRRAERLARVKNLRVLNAPKWIIRYEQVHLVLIRQGLKPSSIPSKVTEKQHELVEKYVKPLMITGE